MIMLFQEAELRIADLTRMLASTGTNWFGIPTYAGSRDDRLAWAHERSELDQLLENLWVIFRADGLDEIPLDYNPTLGLPSGGPLHTGGILTHLKEMRRAYVMSRPENHAIPSLNYDLTIPLAIGGIWTTLARSGIRSASSELGFEIAGEVSGQPIGLLAATRSRISRTPYATGPKEGVGELYVHTWQGAWRGNAVGAGAGGRIWATPYSASELANMSRLQRVWHIGRAKLPTDSVRVTGDALGEFTPVRGIGPFRLGWKRASGQYFTKGPGSIDLKTGVRTADIGARLRFAGMSTGSYTMDGLLVGALGGSIYAYANGGWGTVFDAFIGNPKPVGY